MNRLLEQRVKLCTAAYEDLPNRRCAFDVALAYAANGDLEQTAHWIEVAGKPYVYLRLFEDKTRRATSAVANFLST